MPRIDDTPAAPSHDRTPDSTPLPGGGRWEWDDINGAWRSRDEQAQAESAEPAQE